MLLSLAGTQLLSTTMGVKDYVQSEFESVEAEIINANKDLFPGTITFDDFLWALEYSGPGYFQSSVEISLLSYRLLIW